MTLARWIALAVLALVAAGALLVLVGDRVDDTFCTADAIIVDEPPGWHVSRDGENNCRWTLFNDAGDRAPDELYESLPIDPPPPIGSDRTTVIAAAVLALSAAGAVAVVVTRPPRRTNDD